LVPLKIEIYFFITYFVSYNQSSQIPKSNQTLATNKMSTITDMNNLNLATNIDISCPICLEELKPGSTNFTSTPCGHCFHSTCLLENVVRNGAGCPYCRHQMVEDPDQEIVDDDTIDSAHARYVSDRERQQMEDDALRGLRFFTNNIEGVPHENSDLLDEDSDPHEPPQAGDPKPTAAQIAERLLADGVSMEDLVKAMLVEHVEYDSEEDECIEKGDDIFGKMRIIISNWEGNQLPL